MERQEARTLVIAALESNKYDQGCGFLQKDGIWCCLGAMSDTLGVKCKASKQPGGAFFYGEEETYSVAPDELIQLLGLFGGHGQHRDGGPSLVALNDDTNTTFPEIAKLLRKGEYWE